MGICNVTPDSFSDGGLYATLEAARARVDALLSEGADIVDVGAESTRPGAKPVPAKEQISRALEVVRYAASRGVCVSIDTQDAEVAAACLDAGAACVNDVSCLRDPMLAKVAAAHGAAFVLMHARGPQEKMRGFSDYPDEGYGDVVADVLREWGDAAARARACGVEALVMDPGLGFAKNAKQSATLLARIEEVVRGVGVPVLVGASRKSFLGKELAPAERVAPSIAAAVHSAKSGVSIVRVHDVRETAAALELDHRHVHEGGGA
jgi:dihydropteroate synthase